MTTARIFSVNEITVFRLLAFALAGRKPYILATSPFFPPLRGLLDALTKWLIAGDRARTMVDLCPSVRWLCDYPTRTLLYDVFARTEDWHNRHYEFARADQAVPDYAYAYRNASCSHAKPLHFHALLLEAAAAATGGAMRVHGLLGDGIGILEAYCGRSFRSVATPLPLPYRFLNALTASMAALYGIGWVLGRVRPAAPPKSVFFAADYHEDPRDFPLYREMADGGEVLLIQRAPDRRVEPYPELRSYALCRPRDGVFDLAEAWRTIGMIVRDAFRIWRALGRREPALFYQAAALPVRRAFLRGLFRRHRPRFFWGRDDYNPEHVLRHQELARIGGKSFGLSHGYPAYANVFPMWRYVSFDRYYVFGCAGYERYIGESWPKGMTVIPIGSFAAVRSDYGRIALPESRDILVFVAVFIGLPQMVALVRRLSELFDDRTVHLQLKSIFVETAEGRKFADDCARGRPNVARVTGKFLDLAAKGRYVISDPSTIVIETLQFGQIAFCADIMPEQKTSVYRDYPELCITSAEDAHARIRAIEQGDKAYPRESFSRLVDLSGNVFHDVVRRDVGLEPIAPLKVVNPCRLEPAR